LSELIAYSLSEYEALAVRLTADPERLGKIRETLARNRVATSLFDTAVYARKLEAAYETIYERYLSGAGPAHVNEHLAV
jgi:predicted O-linked N-acetylglucosamine transferase (SPINDLY family)